jgi:catechol 2,3-dioxygenase-like lactoylglutathione lyase family enzyme
MAFHHVALATRDLDATHRFYTEVMGFELVKTVVAPTPGDRGWARHVFYDTGGNGLMAFWDLHDDSIPEFDSAISTGMGLPEWVNHIAFDAALSDLPSRIERWTDAGYDVAEIDHGFCISIYAVDPNGILVEFCADTRPFDDADRAHALRAVQATAPELEQPPMPTFHEGRKPVPAG